jgi:hypothetical protein
MTRDRADREHSPGAEFEFRGTAHCICSYKQLRKSRVKMNRNLAAQEYRKFSTTRQYGSKGNQDATTSWKMSHRC